MKEIVVLTIDNANKHLEGAVARSARRTIDQLTRQPFFGDQVRKEQIPKSLFHLPNLWRADLARFWRMLYYITSDEEHTYVVIFEICDHQEYDRIFGYKK